VTLIIDAAPLVALANISDPQRAAVGRVFQADLRLGLADLSVVVLAARLDTLRILTFDYRHFRAVRPLQGGSFVLLPMDENAEDA